MDMGFLLGLLLALVNGLVCLALPAVLATAQKKRWPTANLGAVSPALESSEFISQEVN